MDPGRRVGRTVRALLYVALALLLVSSAGRVVYRLTSGTSLGLRGLIDAQIWTASNLARAIGDRSHVRGDSRGEFTNVVFLHHSVGNNLIVQGRVRERFAEAGVRFWDQGYGIDGLRDSAGSQTGYSYAIPNNNTDPDGLAGIFSQPAMGIPLNAFSALLQHEVIVFKSCFPVSNISSDEQLERYKSDYRTIRDAMDRHTDRLFVVVTPPPLNPVETTPESARRARAFADWLGSEDYLGGRPNIRTFDLFGYLAEQDATSPDFNALRAVYRTGDDSHPNRTANEAIGPALVDFILRVVTSYRTSTQVT